MKSKTAGWRVGVGLVLTITLPAVILWKLHGDTGNLPRAEQFVVLFFLAMIAVKIGKWIAGSWWDQTLRSVVDDAVFSLFLALVAYGVSAWLAHHGGGQVNPALAALAGAYLLMVWPLRI